MERERYSHSECVYLGSSEAGIAIHSGPEEAMGQMALDVDSPGQGA